MYLELARFLAPGTDTLTDPAFEAYHGLAAVPVAAQLSEPGQKVAELQAVVTMSYLEGQQAGTLTQPALPPPDPPANPKVTCLPTIAEQRISCYACRQTRVWYGPHGWQSA